MNLSRRSFLGASVAGFAATHAILADDKPTDKPADKTDAAKPVETTKISDDPAFQPNTLFLTWQRDPTTTMTIQWVGTTGETADTTIRYTTNPLGTSWQSQATTPKPYPLSDFKVFRAELTGLEPGTDYHFKIGRRSPVYRFRTMPAKATNTIHFISGGDCGSNVHTVSNNVQAARQDPMFALIGGDLAYEDGKSVELNLAFLRNYSKHMVGQNGRLIPMVACLGNHEVVGGYNKTREAAPFFYSLFDGLFSDHGYATLDFGDYLSLVLLDTSHTSPIEGAQTEWLESTLKARADHPNVFVVNHVPAYPSYRNPDGVPATDKKAAKAGTGEGNRKHWVPLFDKYRVPVVLEHHDHTFKRTKTLIDGLANDNGVLYLGDGSWGRLRNPKAPEKIPYLAAASRDFHLSLHRIQGEERFHLALDEHGKVMDVCRTAQRKTGIVRASG
jgi:hypothetical protein